MALLSSQHADKYNLGEHALFAGDDSFADLDSCVVLGIFARISFL
jgi:hypothetical protein